MKRFGYILLLAILSSQMVFGQTRESCITYDSHRTLEGFKQVILTWKDPFISRELWPAYAKRANEILQTSKLEEVRSFNVTPDLSGMTWLMGNSKLYTNENFDQSNYLNGIRIDNILDYQDVPGLKSDWIVLEFEDVRDMYAKSACCNAETPKPKPIQFTPTTPAFPPMTQTLNINLNIGFKDTLVIKHTFDKIHLVFDNQLMVVPKAPEPYKFVPDTTTKTKWYKTTVAKIGGGLIIGGVASYFLFKPKKTGEPAPATKPDDGGKPAGTPGFPADDDGSPDGTPGSPADTGDPEFVPGFDAQALIPIKLKYQVGVSIPINWFSH